MLVSLDEIAVVDDNCIEVAPFGYVLWQAVLLSDVGLALFDFALDRLY